MRRALLLFLLPLFAACASGPPAPDGGQGLYVPEDLPDICKEIDFLRNPEYQDLCGVKSRKYAAYRNLPAHRDLLRPKNAKIVRKADRLELRLERCLPIAMPADLEREIDFSEASRRSPLKSEMEYAEALLLSHAGGAEGGESDDRERILRITLPLKNGGSRGLCYRVVVPRELAQRKPGYASELVELHCEEFDRRYALLRLRRP